VTSGVELLLTITNVIGFLQVSMRTEVKIVKDMLKGDDMYEIRLRLIETMPEELPYKDDE
jgi:hypothetical protein